MIIKMHAGLALDIVIIQQPLLWLSLGDLVKNGKIIQMKKISM